MGTTTPIIEGFLEDYGVLFHMYRSLAVEVKEICEKSLKKRGIRHIASCRAKDKDSAKGSILRRQKQRHEGDFKSKEEIVEAMHDLAGVRLALYLPGQAGDVYMFIKEMFIIIKETPWPDYNSLHNPKRGAVPYKLIERDFPGYCGIHFHVKLADCDLAGDTGYQNRVVEIQVASLIMHAWADIHHDLIYKPNSGELTADDERILDLSNGIIVAGESALRQLQKNLDQKVKDAHRPIADQYELAVLLKRDWIDKKVEGTPQWRAEFKYLDLLYETLKRFKMDTQEKVQELVKEEAGDLRERDASDIKDDFSEALLVGLSRMRAVKKTLRTELTLEKIELWVNQSTPSTESNRMARYAVWVAVNVFNILVVWDDIDSLNQLEDAFAKQELKPSTDEVLNILHPTKPRMNFPGGLRALDVFARTILRRNRSTKANLAIALSLLGWYPNGGTRDNLVVRSRNGNIAQNCDPMYWETFTACSTRIAKLLPPAQREILDPGYLRTTPNIFKGLARLALDDNSSEIQRTNAKQVGPIFRGPSRRLLDDKPARLSELTGRVSWVGDLYLSDMPVLRAWDPFDEDHEDLNFVSENRNLDSVVNSGKDSVVGRYSGNRRTDEMDEFSFNFYVPSGSGLESELWKAAACRRNDWVFRQVGWEQFKEYLSEYVSEK